MNQTTRIVDLGEAAAVLCMGFELTELQPTNSKAYKIFIFNTSHPAGKFTMNHILQDYNDNLLKVSALDFYNSVKDLKNKIYLDNGLS